jgi:hypothetical protein
MYMHQNDSKDRILRLNSVSNQKLFISFHNHDQVKQTAYKHSISICIAFDKLNYH